jgi:hypothetical protein
MDPLLRIRLKRVLLDLARDPDVKEIGDVIDEALIELTALIPITPELKGFLADRADAH